VQSKSKKSSIKSDLTARDGGACPAKDPPPIAGTVGGASIDFGSIGLI
jgi:hypothetical protein